MAPIMIVVSPLTPRLSARFGANRAVAAGMLHRRHGLLLFRGLGDGHAVLVHRAAAFLPFVSGHGAGHVADDRGDHVRGAGPPGRRRLGHERRHPRARRRARRRRARAASPRLATAPDRRRPSAASAPATRRRRRRRSPARSTSAQASPSRPAPRSTSAAEHAFLVGHAPRRPRSARRWLPSAPPSCTATCPIRSAPEGAHARPDRVASRTPPSSASAACRRSSPTAPDQACVSGGCRSAASGCRTRMALRGSMPQPWR